MKNLWIQKIVINQTLNFCFWYILVWWGYSLNLVFPNHNNFVWLHLQFTNYKYRDTNTQIQIQSLILDRDFSESQRLLCLIVFLQFGIVWFCLDANHHKEKMEQWKHWKIFCFSLWCFLSLEYAILYVTFFTDDQLNIHVAISRERKELSYLKFNSFLNPGIWGDFFLDFSVIFVWTSENIEFHIFLVSWFF